MSEQFVGAGIAYPVRVDAAGRVALAASHGEICEAIRLILGTSYGERPMRPEFGCGIHHYVFAPANATTAGELAWEVRQSLARWEPRIRVDDVVVTVDSQERNTLYIDIRYSLKGSNDPRNLVFPFYVIPGGD